MVVRQAVAGSTNGLGLVDDATLLGVVRGDAVALVEAFWRGRRASTLAAYRADLEAFREFLDAATIARAAQRLLAHGAGAANALALDYRAALVDRGLAASTINRRLATLRALVALARTVGAVNWRLEVPNVQSVPYRDTRGPGAKGFRSMVAQLEGRDDPMACRDRAVVRLLFDVALRRGEVVGLDLEDVDLKTGTLAVRQKGREEKILLSLPTLTQQALAAWLRARGGQPGPLFLNFDPAGKGDRLTGRSVGRLVDRLGQAAGLKVRPHGLRHAAITEALELTGGNVRAVQRFSRHARIETVLRYDDNRQDLGGEIAGLVAGEAG